MRLTWAPSNSCGFSARGRASAMGSKGEGGISPRHSVEVDRRKKSQGSLLEDNLKAGSRLWLSSSGVRMFYSKSQQTHNTLTHTYQDDAKYTDL